MTVITVCLPHHTVGSTSSRAVRFGRPNPRFSPRAQQHEQKRVNVVHGQKENDEYGEVGLPAPTLAFPTLPGLHLHMQMWGGWWESRSESQTGQGVLLQGGERLTSSCVWYIEDSQRIQSHPFQALGLHIHPVKAPEVDCPLGIPHKHRVKQ